MIHCLDDGGNPITILDLCGYSEQEAADMLVDLRSEMLANPQKWARENGGLNWPGVRVIIEHPGPRGDSMERHPLEDPREHYYGLHPDFGLKTCWFCCVTDKTGPFKGLTRLMYVVRPDEDFKPGKKSSACSSLDLTIVHHEIEQSMPAMLEKIPIVGKLVEVARLIAADAAFTREEVS